MFPIRAALPKSPASPPIAQTLWQDKIQTQDQEPPLLGSIARRSPKSFPIPIPQSSNSAMPDAILVSALATPIGISPSSKISGSPNPKTSNSAPNSSTSSTIRTSASQTAT